MKIIPDSFRPTIRLKLMIIISVVVLTSLTLLIIIALNIFTNDMTNMINVVNSRTSKLLAEKIESEISRKRESLTMIHRLMKNQPESSENMLVDTYFQNPADLLYTVSYKVENNVVSDVNFNLYDDKTLKNAGLKPADLYNYTGSKKDVIQRILKGESIIENATPGLEKATWYFGFPVFDADDSVESIVISIFSLKSLGDVFTADDRKAIDAGFKTLYSSFLVDSEGNIIVHPEQSMVQKSVNVIDHPVVKKMYSISTRSGLITFEENGVEKFGAFYRLGMAGLGTVTTVEVDRALESVQIVRMRSLLVSLLIISVAILFVYYFSKTMSEPIKELVGAARGIREGEFDQKVTPRTRDEIGELTRAFNEMSSGLEEREKLKGAFGKFVNEEIADQILSGGLALGGETKEVAVFFSDIRSFTAISEKLEPAEVVEFLNEYMTLMVDIIHRTNGVVDKFIGDAIMAVWGAPVSHGNDTANCIDAALLMREALIKFNKNRGGAKNPPIHIGSGIAFGPVLAGQIGSEDRLEYTVIGDTVNLASRLEALNKAFGTDIIISQPAYEKVKDRYVCKPMDKIKVKGKTKPQQVYAVLGRKGDTRAPKDIKELQKITGISTPSKRSKPSKKEDKYEII